MNKCVSCFYIISNAWVIYDEIVLIKSWDKFCFSLLLFWLDPNLPLKKSTSHEPSNAEFSQTVG